MNLDSFLSYLMGLIFDVKYQLKNVDFKAERLWKRWRWFKSLNVAESLNYIADIEKLLVGMLAEILDLDGFEMSRIYNETF